MTTDIRVVRDYAILGESVEVAFPDYSLGGKFGHGRISPSDEGHAGLGCELPRKDDQPVANNGKGHPAHAPDIMILAVIPTPGLEHKPKDIARPCDRALVRCVRIAEESPYHADLDIAPSARRCSHYAPPIGSETLDGEVKRRILGAVDVRNVARHDLVAVRRVTLIVRAQTHPRRRDNRGEYHGPKPTLAVTCHFRNICLLCRSPCSRRLGSRTGFSRSGCECQRSRASNACFPRHT